VEVDVTLLLRTPGDGAVDAWALRCVAPAIPILLHGRGAAQIRLLLRTLGGLPDVLSTDALSSSFASVAERLFALGRASCAADALCLSAGGAGQGPSAAQAIDLRDVMSATADCLKQSAIAQEPTREKAAELLHISVRDLYRGRKPRQ